jgi:hypothetical protein
MTPKWQPGEVIITMGNFGARGSNNYYGKLWGQGEVIITMWKATIFVLFKMFTLGSLIIVKIVKCHTYD